MIFLHYMKCIGFSIILNMNSIMKIILSFEDNSLYEDIYLKARSVMQKHHLYKFFTNMPSQLYDCWDYFRNDLHINL